MKNLVFLVLLVLLTSCKAQQPISQTKEGKVKIAGKSFYIKKLTDKYTEVINSNNKLTNVQPAELKLSNGIVVVQHMKIDEKKLIQICADVIPLKTLKELPKGYGDWLSIRFKVDSKGIPLEMEFLIRNTSLITAGELQQIEEKIKNSSFKITFTDGIERFFSRINYFNIDIPVRYGDILKAKEGN
ncbi:hypothetical protein [Pedobacter sp. R-06]|uniref:hypothetical protein n=1 Tax=Pedobacter sp. R-06 TaxID=3404051 RepID=UPI003CFBAEAF